MGRFLESTAPIRGQQMWWPLLQSQLNLGAGPPFPAIIHPASAPADTALETEKHNRTFKKMAFSQPGWTAT